MHRKCQLHHQFENFTVDTGEKFLRFFFRLRLQLILKQYLRRWKITGETVQSVCNSLCGMRFGNANAHNCHALPPVRWAFEIKRIQSFRLMLLTLHKFKHFENKQYFPFGFFNKIFVAQAKYFATIFTLSFAIFQSNYKWMWHSNKFAESHILVNTHLCPCLVEQFALHSRKNVSFEIEWNTTNRNWIRTRFDCVPMKIHK